MTYRSIFRVGKELLFCYFTVAAWLSNGCHGFSTSLDLFSPKIESLCMR